MRVFHQDKLKRQQNYPLPEGLRNQTARSSSDLGGGFNNQGFGQNFDEYSDDQRNDYADRPLSIKAHEVLKKLELLILQSNLSGTLGNYCESYKRWRCESCQPLCRVGRTDHSKLSKPPKESDGWLER